MLTPGPTGDGSRPFFGRVESLRGLGTMAVAGYHFSGTPIHGVPILSPKHWLDPSPVQYAVGRIAFACLPGHAFLLTFFVISGLVLRVSLQFGPPGMRGAAKFTIARLFRFYPIVVVGALAAVVSKVGPAASEFTLERFVANALLLDVSWNSHLWALQVEVLMVPVILLLFFLEKRLGLIVLLVVAVVTTGLAFAPHWAISLGLSTNMFAFVLGMAIPTYGQKYVAKLKRSQATALLVAATIPLFAAGLVFGMYSRFSSLVEAYAAFVVLTLVAYRSDLPCLRCLDGRWLRRLGGASGSYYVLHMSTIALALPVFTWLIHPEWIANYPATVGSLALFVWLVAIAPLMIVVSRLVEVPGVAAGRRLCQTLGLERRKEALPHAVAQPVRLAA